MIEAPAANKVVEASNRYYADAVPHFLQAKAKSDIGLNFAYLAKRQNIDAHGSVGERAGSGGSRHRRLGSGSSRS